MSSAALLDFKNSEWINLSWKRRLETIRLDDDGPMDAIAPKDNQDNVW